MCLPTDLERKKRDILIIGSGPAGLSAAIYAKQANLDVIITEKEFMGTGQIAEISRVDNYIGLVGMSGFELGEIFRSDAENAGAEFLEVEAVGLFRRDNVWVAAPVDGGDIEARVVIYAAGASHRRLNVLGEDKFIGNGVSFCALCDGSFYRRKNVAVIGGGDTAVDDALYLANIAEKVYLIHRRNTFRAAAMGRQVTFFFMFWGLNILRKPDKVKTKKTFIEKMFGTMMPRGTKKLGLSGMNMGGMGAMNPEEPPR